MPRKSSKTEVLTPKKAPKTKTTSKVVKKETPKKEAPKFAFGGSNGRMTKEERDAIISESLKVKPKMNYTLEESQYSPSSWVVVVTPTGNIYQEPVPRYFPFETFVAMMAGCPDNPILGNKIDFEEDLFYTSFEVPGVDCNIITCNFDGTRKENAYSCVFDIKSGTDKVGGNIVFAGSKGFTNIQAQKVIKEIIKKFNTYEEIA